MSSALFRYSLLAATVSMTAACDDLSLRRSSESAAADTAAASESSPGARSRRPTEKASSSSPEVESRSFAEIRRALGRLVAAEETFFAENGTYSDQLSLIRADPGNDVSVRFLWLSRDGWAASGSHSGLAGRDCVVFVGRAHAPPTTLKYGRPAREGVSVCDDRRVPAKAQAAVPPARVPPAVTPDTTNQLELLDPRVVMKVDLRNLAHSQETYFKMQGSYARRTEALALQYLWHRDVQIKILAADAQSWAAKATHARFPGKSCVIWLGAVAQRPGTDAQGRVEGRSGVPVCDD